MGEVLLLQLLLHSYRHAFMQTCMALYRMWSNCGSLGVLGTVRLAQQQQQQRQKQEQHSLITSLSLGTVFVGSH
jgi:hypothetical protein